MFEMGDEESLYSIYKELSAVKKKLKAIEQKKSILKHNQFVARMEDKLERFSSLIKTINEDQERINNKKTTIVFKMPEKSICTNNNSLQLTYTHHDDFINIIRSKPKIEELIYDCQTCENRYTDLKFIINEFKNINSSWSTQFYEQLCEYRSAKGLLENIEQLNEIDKSNNDETTVFEKSDSDLGCYPNDSATEENTTALIQFATSSPISRNKLEF